MGGSEKAVEAADGGDAEETDGGIPERETWSSGLDFILSVVGFAVGLGNVWRFPYLCYKNGGGAFFIPYFVCLITGGVPIFFMEIALGQYMSKGGLGAWRIAPIFMGIGICTTIMTFLLNVYYIVVLAWDLSYMSHAFQAVLPWSHCSNEWNTVNCYDPFGPEENCTEVLSGGGNWSAITTQACESFVNPPLVGNRTDPVVEFWERKILQISSGVDESGGIVWQLAVALAVAWVLCYFCIWKGVKWTGKVVYFTATFPYVMLTVLLIRGVTLPGAKEGIIFYLYPDFSRLSDSQVWLDAGTQIFFSYAIANSSMLALGSYNKFKNNCYKDCILISCINCCTSVYAGFAIFSVLGFMAHEQGVSVADVAESGPGLAFIAYPKAVTQMPWAPVWAVLFFFMILILGLDSQFVSMEGLITVITDMFPALRKGYNRPIFISVYAVVSFLLGLTMATRGGMYVFQLFDYYSASGMVLLWTCFCEVVCVAWVYGGDRFYDNIEMMIGYKINPLLKWIWTYVTPVVTGAIFIFMWVTFKPLTYNRTYTYPMWAQSLGMMMGFLSMFAIPVFAVFKMATTPGTMKERWRILTTPVLYPERIPEKWADYKHLEAIGKRGIKLDDQQMLFSKANPAYVYPEMDPVFTKHNV